MENIHKDDYCDQPKNSTTQNSWNGCGPLSPLPAHHRSPETPNLKLHGLVTSYTLTGRVAHENEEIALPARGKLGTGGQGNEGGGGTRVAGGGKCVLVEEWLLQHCMPET